MQDLMQSHWHHLPEVEVADLLDADAERGLDLAAEHGRVPRLDTVPFEFQTDPISAGYCLAIRAVGLAIYGSMGLEKLVRPSGLREPAAARPKG